MNKKIVLGPDDDPSLQIYADLGNNVILLRTMRKWTQVDLSEHSGVSRATICLIEAGRGDPTMGTVISLAKALGVTPRHLFDRSEQCSALYP